MAKDDYDRIACLILTYLYARLRGKTETEPEEYLQPLTEAFPVSEEYFYSVLEDLLNAGYIKGAHVVKAWGGDIVEVAGLRSMKISGEGVHFLKENSSMRKTMIWLRDNSAPVPGLVTTILSLLEV